MGELADLNDRTRRPPRKSTFPPPTAKRSGSIELEDATCNLGDRTLFDNLNFIVTAGMRVGLVGPNGSGKTTLLRLLQGESVADCGPNSPRRLAAHRLL